MSERIAIVTDPHANCQHSRRRSPGSSSTGSSAPYWGGDLVGYGPHPNDVCALLVDRRIPTIYGNYDYAIGRDLEDYGCAYRDRHERDRSALHRLDAREYERGLEGVHALAPLRPLLRQQRHGPPAIQASGARVFVQRGAVSIGSPIGGRGGRGTRHQYVAWMRIPSSRRASARRVGADARAPTYRPR